MPSAGFHHLCILTRLSAVSWGKHMNNLKFLRRRKFLQLAASAASLPSFHGAAWAQSQPSGPREVAARSIPVPETVSPQMQAVIARAFNPNFNLVPETTADWKKRVEEAARNVVATLPQLREAL